GITWFGAKGSPTHMMVVEVTPERDYRKMIEEIRGAVQDLLAPEAAVLVISKGDEELLKLGGRRGWHFPQDASGVYAGHYPADSAAAIAHLEELRARRGQFLVVPATSQWWLDHYAEFHQHL